MSTITALVGGDGITTANSMTKINTNFTNLNTDKMETSVLDTDTTLAANSDLKIATQKAVKTYVDLGGNINASTTARGIVEEATVAEIAAGTAAGGTTARLFINPSSTISTSAGAADVGKVPRVNASGQLDITFTGTYSKTGKTTHDISSAASTVIAHGLGKLPSFIKVTAIFQSATAVSWALTTFSGSTQNSLKWALDSGTGTGIIAGNDFTIYDAIGTKFETGTVTLDATNITIAWAKTSTPTGTFDLVWEAYA